MVAPAVLAVLVTGPLSGVVVDRVEVMRLADSLAQLRSEARTVQIDFRLARTNFLGKKQSYTGRLVALRDPDRAVHAILRLESDTDRRDVESFLLRGDCVYEYSAPARTVTPFQFEAGPLGFLAGHWRGPLWLLDRREGLRRCDVRVLKRDLHHTYFTVKVEEQSFLALLGGRPVSEVREYKLTRVRTATDELPAGAVRQVARTLPNGDHEVFTVTRWVVDGPDRITAADFPDPAKLPAGWTLKPRPEWPRAKPTPDPGK